MIAQTSRAPLPATAKIGWVVPVDSRRQREPSHGRSAVGGDLHARLDRVGHVTVTLQLTSDVAPRSDASATIAASDFFGAKFVDYFPGAKTEPLGPGQTITGTLQPQLADVASGVATRANELLGSAKGLVSDQLAVDIHNTMVARTPTPSGSSQCTPRRGLTCLYGCVVLYGRPSSLSLRC